MSDYKVSGTGAATQVFPNNRPDGFKQAGPWSSTGISTNRLGMGDAYTGIPYNVIAEVQSKSGSSKDCGFEEGCFAQGGSFEFTESEHMVRQQTKMPEISDSKKSNALEEKESEDISVQARSNDAVNGATKNHKFKNSRVANGISSMPRNFVRGTAGTFYLICMGWAPISHQGLTLTQTYAKNGRDFCRSVAAVVTLGVVGSSDHSLIKTKRQDHFNGPFDCKFHRLELTSDLFRNNGKTFLKESDYKGSSAHDKLKSEIFHTLSHMNDDEKASLTKNIAAYMKEQKDGAAKEGSLFFKKYDYKAKPVRVGRTKHLLKSQIKHPVMHQIVDEAAKIVRSERAKSIE